MKKFILFALTLITAASCTCHKADEKAAAANAVIRTDVQEKGYFKDLFIDSGLIINGFPDMPAVDYLGLTSETLRLSGDSLPNQQIQRMVFCGSEEDANGRLLYPDGEPRFRAIYVNGGLANSHGTTLELAGRTNFRTFVENGGSYTGSCAGAYLCTRGIDFDRYHGGYLGLWPGTADEGVITRVFPNYIIPENSPLLKYYDFGGDFKIDSVKHWNGAYFEHWDQVPGTEVLAINDYPPYKYHNQPSIIAYKQDIFTGRVIPCGGHPEQVRDGERRDLMAAILLYAFDGNGIATVKGLLSNGETRKMTKKTEDADPAFTAIGDKQNHHFAFALPAKARNVKVTLKTLADHNLSLRMAEGTFAFADNARYKVENGEAVKELTFETLPAGTWYIGVQCEDTITAEETETCDTYTGTDVLNGVPYTISVKWDYAKTGKAVLCNGSDANEKMKLLCHDVTRYEWLDSTVTRIVLKTKSCRKGEVRLDGKGSEEPVYASLNRKNGVLTISTPATEICSNYTTSYLFAGFTALKEIQNLKALNTADSKSIQGLFCDCMSLESVDITSLDVTNVMAFYEMFRHMPALKSLNIGDMAYTDSLRLKPQYFFSSPRDSMGVRTSSLSGELNIRCTSDGAQWLAGTNLRWINSGWKENEPVKVRFFDWKTGEELFPCWAKN